MTYGGPPVGLVLGSALPPEQIQRVAATAEELGFGQFWLAEDYFFTGGISGATGALAATQRAPVGLGIVSAMVRHPALLAMELSTMARMYPGRVLPGIGLGLPHWVRQMGLHPKSSLGALRECLTSVRELLDGGSVTARGDSFAFDQVQLTYPVTEERLPLYMGVIGPKMLQLSGEIADGTVLSVLASARYVEWARERIAEGAQRGGRDGHHKIATFALFAVDEDGDKAKREIRDLFAFYLAAMAQSPIVSSYGISDEVVELAEGGPEALARSMPDQWVEDLAIAGDPAECAEKIDRLIAAGSDSVELFVVPPDRAGELTELAAEQVLPRVTARVGEGA
jgi:alkanesulfonate monooxygenase SsuD/methylene tetrahydromethanopterin reductase-like flavin-dependent oxidoreductase (luciferase family)